MSFVTTCPACSTSFVVRQAQLDAHQGKVRCGHCRHVFNAMDRLAQSSESSSADFPATVDLSSQAAYPMTLMEPSLHPRKFKIEETNLRQNDRDSNGQPEISVQTDTFEPMIASVADLPLDTSFLDKTEAKSYKRWPYAISAVFLILIAMLQIAYYLRDDIAQRYPQTKVYMVKACEYLGCEIALPQNLALLNLVDSDMQEHNEYQEVLQFSTTMVNRANHEQALPLLELTLTSLDDTPVLRRLFKPKEYLPQLKNQIAAKEEIHIKLDLSAEEVAVAGYRVQLVY